MNLKTAQRRYKVFEDASYALETEPGKTDNQWRYYELRGPHGYLYSYSESHLACVVFASTEPHAENRSQKAVKAIAEHLDWKVIQSGDQETTFLLENKDLESAAQLISARIKRVGNPANGARLAAFQIKPGSNRPPAQTEEKWS